MYMMFETPHKKLRIFLSKLGIKSAQQGFVIWWDPAANGGVGAEYEY